MHKNTIGAADYIQLDILSKPVPARIDTGARTSAIWVSRAEIVDDVLEVVFFGPDSPYFDKKVHRYRDFERLEVASSNGSREIRFVIKLAVRLAGRKIRARFTLANRSTQVYPVLIGRNVLRGKFVVDVSQGHLLAEQERQRNKEAAEAANRTEEQM